MKITDLKCTVLGQTPVVRITTDEGISGLGPVESYKPYLTPHVQFYKQMIVGEDPTNWWYDIVDGLPNPIAKDGFVEVWDRPGLGVEINAQAARQYLPEGDQDFFDD